MKIKTGDMIDVEDAWEDEAGGRHDEVAEVIAVKDDGTLELNFLHVSKEVQDFLKECNFEAKDYEDYIIT